MKDTRAKNVASIEDIAKVIRGSKLVQKDMEGAYESNLDVVVERFEAFIIDLVRCTPRPTSKLISAAAAGAFDVELAETVMFGERINAAVQFCRGKSITMTTGKKLTGSTMRVAKELRESRTSSPLTRSPSLMSVQSPPSHASPSSSSKVMHVPIETPVLSRSASILALYAKVAPTASPKRPHRAVEIESSQDCIEVESVGPPSVAPEELELSVPFVVAADRAMCRFEGGVNKRARMSPGPDGFAIARFENGDEFATEIPNLALLACPMKKPAAAKDKAEAKKTVEPTKAPPKVVAHADPKEGSELVAYVAPKEKGKGKGKADIVADRTYSKMFYKKANNFGIRQKFFEKRQVYTVSNRALRKDQLEAVASELIGALEAGLPEDDCAEWCERAFGKLIDDGDDID
jgi:hypothetical protein